MTPEKALGRALSLIKQRTTDTEMVVVTMGGRRIGEFFNEEDAHEFIVAVAKPIADAIVAASLVAVDLHKRGDR